MEKQLSPTFIADNIAQIDNKLEQINYYSNDDDMMIELWTKLCKYSVMELKKKIGEDNIRNPKYNHLKLIKHLLTIIDDKKEMTKTYFSIKSKEMEKKEVYNLSLDQVELKNWFKLNRSSLGQLLGQLQKVDIKNPNNEYKISFKAWIKNSGDIQELVSAYNNILRSNSKIEYNVKKVNLLGNLPKDIIVNTSHNDTNLNKSRIGDIIRASKQRIIYMITRELPERYMDDKKERIEFRKIQFQMVWFLLVMIKFECKFVTTNKKCKGNK